MTTIELALRRAAGEVAKIGNSNVARWRSGITDQRWLRGYTDGILAAQSILATLADEQSTATREHP